MPLTVTVPVPDVAAIREAAAPYTPVTGVSLLIGVVYALMKFDKKRPAVKGRIARVVKSPPAAWSYLTGMTAAWCAFAEWAAANPGWSHTLAAPAAAGGAVGTGFIGAWAAKRVFGRMVERVHGPKPDATREVLEAAQLQAQTVQAGAKTPDIFGRSGDGDPRTEPNAPPSRLIGPADVSDVANWIRHKFVVRPYDVELYDHGVLGGGEVVAIRLRLRENYTDNRVRLSRLAAYFDDTVSIAECHAGELIYELVFTGEEIDRLLAMDDNTRVGVISGQYCKFPYPILWT